MQVVVNAIRIKGRIKGELIGYFIGGLLIALCEKLVY